MIFLLAMLYPAAAKAAEPSDVQKKLDEQQKEIDKLRLDMDKLKQDSRMRAVHSEFSGHIGIFADADFSTKSREKSKDSFFIGDLDIHASGNYADRLTSFLELLVENEEEGFIVDVARLWIGYSFSDLLIVRAGKQHAALGYWNKTYHHGKQLFTTIDRPFFLAFEYESGVLPVHTTGIELEGKWPYPFAKMKYEFEVGNGPHINPATGKLAPNSAADNNGVKQFALRISGQPAAIANLSMGVSGALFTVNTGTKGDIEEQVYGADMAYSYRGIEFLAEYFGLLNSYAASSAFYAQLAYSLKEDITPYARYEALQADGGDPYLKSLSGGFSRKQAIAGIKYDIDVVKSSIKIQYRHDDAQNRNTYDVLEAQWSFGF